MGDTKEHTNTANANSHDLLLVNPDGYVLAVTAEVLGTRAVALTAHSPAVPEAEREEARRAERVLARREGDAADHQIAQHLCCHVVRGERF